MFRGHSLSALLALAALALAGCATPPAPQAQPFAQAIDSAADALVREAQGPAFLAQLSTRTVVLDPSLDAATGQQTAATQQLDRAISERVGRPDSKITVLPFQSASLSKAQSLLVGTLARAPEGWKIDLAMVDLKDGKVLGQASALSTSAGVDMTPLPYYRDSPVMVMDKVTAGYVQSARTPRGQPADPAYLERIASATVINEATALYDSARYREAMGQYRSALAMPQGEQIRALTGVYLSAVRLGQTAEAEQAFARLVAFGMASGNLGMKFLFSPGSTDFWPDPKISGAYGMWLRQLARQSSGAKVCMDIVGHTSRTGTEVANDALSLKRALYIRQRLGSEAPELMRRTQAQGMGARQNIVGSGTDDVVDAPDRRVEFSIVDCATLKAGS